MRLISETLVAPQPDHDVLPHLEYAIERLPRALKRDVGLLLRVLELRLFNAFLIGSATSFSNLTPGDRERVFLALAHSRIGKLRKAFQGLKRLVCFYAYAVPDSEAVRSIAYDPAPLLPSRAPRLPLASITGDTIDADVCIIGSGAGGGVMAAELAADGRRVIVLEQGSPQQAEDFGHREIDGVEALFLEGGRLSSRDLGVLILAGNALGGGTTVNWQTSFRTPDAVRQEWAQRSGCGFFTESSFDHALDAVLQRLSVTTAESTVNANNDVLRRGSEALGYRWGIIPRNARGCDLDQCGACIYGCRTGGKQSTTVTYLRDAVETGNASVMADCRVERIEIRDRVVTGVRASLHDRTLTGVITVRAPMVVVAAGGIESPAILLRSGVSLPQMGRHLYLHPASSVVGFYDAPIRPWHGPPQSIICDEYAQMDGGYGVRLETAPAHPAFLSLALPWHGAAAHRELMQNVAHASVIVALTRDRTGGRVSIDREGRAAVDYRPGVRERGYLNAGLQAAARVHQAAGANRIVTLHSKPLEWRRGEDIERFCGEIKRREFADNWSPLFSAHQMGTCRMGADADSAVCDRDGQVFGVKGLFIGDASAFPGSCGVNPMITVMALAFHTAQVMKS